MKRRGNEANCSKVAHGYRGRVGRRVEADAEAYCSVQCRLAGGLAVCLGRGRSQHLSTNSELLKELLVAVNSQSGGSEEEL